MLTSVPVDLDQSLVADPEMVRDLVEHDSLRLRPQTFGIGSIQAFEWRAIDRDLVGQRARVVDAAPRQRHPLVETKESLVGRLVLDHDLDVRDPLTQVRRDRVDRVFDEPLDIGRRSVYSAGQTIRSAVSP
jgi:hypothetical protein